MSDQECFCPRCGEECYRDEADVGIGIIYGPWGCCCGWSSDPRYDSSQGPSPAQLENPGWYVDSTGGMQRVDAIVGKCERFGLDGDVVREAFEVRATPGEQR
jgi:hypothetical protein